MKRNGPTSSLVMWLECEAEEGSEAMNITWSYPFHKPNLDSDTPLSECQNTCNVVAIRGFRCIPLLISYGYF
jgi:hypothetical protein